MTQDDGNQFPRHPDAVVHLECLGEKGPAVVRTREGGCTRCWLQDGEVRSLDVPVDRPLRAAPVTPL